MSVIDCAISLQETGMIFLDIRFEIHKLTLKLENRIRGSSQHNKTANVISDLTVVKAKGAAKEKILCKEETLFSLQENQTQ